jgi:beta-galactosidase
MKIYCDKFFLFFCLGALAISIPARGQNFTPPASPHAIYNFNADWKFIREDVAGAEQTNFDDTKWATVSAPHTFNDVDSYTGLISHGAGDRRSWTGIVWYRKHFKLPADAKEKKVFLEFEGLKQAGRFWVNGKFAGKYENGITPLGLDLTGLVNFGDAENVIAVKVDNSNDYKEEATGVGFEWMGKAFNPNYGGLNHDIWLQLTSKIYQTLPLYENLKTTGIYIYATNFSIAEKMCDVNIESQVRNESSDSQSITLSAVVVDAAGKIDAHFQSDASDLVSGETEIFKASGQLTNANFWSDAQPNLYDVYSVLTINDQIVDVQKIKTGFRKTEFKGGAGTGGVYVNDKFVYLTGYAQRSSDEWAGLGEAYPDWMHDFNAELIRSTHANYIRWMHISPQAVDVRACDKFGIIEICPAGDKEGDPVLDKRLQPNVAAREWEQRAEVMRDSMIFFRDSPSILFWEAGNTVVTTNHMQQIVDLRKQWDPSGGRVAGTRDNDSPDLNNAITPIAEYYGVMVAQDRRTDAINAPGEFFRGYSVERRDRAPLIEAEDFRDEAARRFWDDFSPPHFGFKKGENDTYNWNSETFCLAAAARYNDYFSNIITNKNPAHARWSGYASIYWSDSNADGRQDSSEVARVSGKVDSVRLPKEAYFVYRVMQSPTPDLHIIGHWTYPTNTVKTIYVAANHCDSVELFVNGTSKGVVTQPTNGYIFAFPKIQFEAGKISAFGKIGTHIVVQDEIATAGAPKRIKLTPHVSPSGLLADGADVAFFDVEVVDDFGIRCPTDEARVDFKLDGPAIWRGGYNSGKINSVNNLYLDTEDGINRVAIRSTLTNGIITLTASRDGLQTGTATIESRVVKIENGLMSAGIFSSGEMQK